MGGRRLLYSSDQRCSTRGSSVCRESRSLVSHAPQPCPLQESAAIVRVGLVPSVLSPHARLIEAALQLGGDWSLVRRILSTATPESEEWGLTEEALTAADDVIRDHVTFVSQTVGVSPQSTTIIANGRVSSQTSRIIML